MKLLVPNWEIYEQMRSLGFNIGSRILKTVIYLSASKTQFSTQYKINN